MKEHGGSPPLRCNLSRLILILAAALAVGVFFGSPSSPSVHHLPTTSTIASIHVTSSPEPRIDTPPRTSLRLDLEAPSFIHGTVHKAGPATLRSWHSSEDKPRRLEWDKFLEKRYAGEISMLQAYDSVPPHGPDPWGCRLYYNDAYKVMFIRTAKTGSTTIVENIFPPCLYKADVPHCMKRVADTNMTAREVIEKWNKYTVFTFTRNVWARGVSQYQYLVHFVKDKPECRRVKWAEYCEDPLAIGRVCRENADCCTKKWTHQDWHMRQQTSCFLTDEGLWATDFIGRLEHFDKDLVELFDIVNRKRDPSMPPLKHTPADQKANSNPLDCQDQIDGKDDTHTDSSSFGGVNGHVDEEEEEEIIALGGKRRLKYATFDTIEGNQLPDVIYCDKRKYFTGRNAKCFNAMAEFFARDVELLHSNLTAVVEGRGEKRRRKLI